MHSLDTYILKNGQKDGKGTYVFNDSGMKYVGGIYKYLAPSEVETLSMVNGCILMEPISRATLITTCRRAREPGTLQTETKWKVCIHR